MKGGKLLLVACESPEMLTFKEFRTRSWISRQRLRLTPGLPCRLTAHRPPRRPSAVRGPLLQTVLGGLYR